MSKPPAPSCPLIRNGLLSGPQEFPSKLITSSGIPVALTKGTRLELTQKAMTEDEKTRLSAFAAGRLMMVSPTQFVPLTTIRDGKERCLALTVML